MLANDSREVREKSVNFIFKIRDGTILGSRLVRKLIVLNEEHNLFNKRKGRRYSSAFVNTKAARGRACYGVEGEFWFA